MELRFWPFIPLFREGSLVVLALGLSLLDLAPSNPPSRPAKAVPSSCPTQVIPLSTSRLVTAATAFCMIASINMNDYVFKRVDISMVVICYASDVIEYGRGTPELSYTPFHITQDATSTEN